MSIIVVDEQYDDSLKCVKWKTELKNRVSCTYNIVHPENTILRFDNKCQFDVDLCLREIKINNEETTSKKDIGIKTVPDYYYSLCDVFATCNKGSRHFFKKMTDSVYWNSEVFRLTVSNTSNLVNFKIWIKFHTFGVSEMKMLQYLSDYLFIDQANCDVKFSFEDGQQIGAHKKILSARSPVFEAMFKNDMLEAKTGQVAIKDIDLKVFKELLYFIYNGRTSETVNETKARPLFLAADKYEILDLKEDCSRKLISSISESNAICVMTWAHENSVDLVKEAALNVVVRNGKKICLQKEWETLTLFHPDLCLLATRRIIEIAEFPAIKRKADYSF